MTTTRSASPVAVTTRPSEAIEPPDQRTEAMVKDFLAVVERDRRNGGDGLLPRQFLNELEPADRLRVARRIAGYADLNIAYFAIRPMAEAGREADTIPILERMLLAGSDLSAVYYMWMHDDDETIGARTHILLCRHLLTNLDNYPKKVRETAERILVEPPEEFSREAAERRIAEFEKLLGATTRSATSAPVKP